MLSLYGQWRFNGFPNSDEWLAIEAAGAATHPVHGSPWAVQSASRCDVHHARARGADLARGVKSNHTLDAHFRHHDELATRLLQALDVSWFLIPETTNYFRPAEPGESWRADEWLRCAYHNLARVEVVALTERLELGLLPQLRLHAPYIAEFAALPTTNTQQQISDSMDNTVPAWPYNTTLAVVRATKSYTRAAAFYSFAARVASARESYARRCLSSAGCGVHLTSPSTVCVHARDRIDRPARDSRPIRILTTRGALLCQVRRRRRVPGEADGSRARDIRPADAGAVQPVVVDAPGSGIIVY